VQRLTMKQAASRLGISTWTLRAKCNAGLIAYLRDGCGPRTFTAEALDAYLDNITRAVKASGQRASNAVIRSRPQSKPYRCLGVRPKCKNDASRAGGYLCPALFAYLPTSVGRSSQERLVSGAREYKS
jgi:excisionase family DNA binding protein